MKSVVRSQLLQGTGVELLLWVQATGLRTSAPSAAAN